MYKILHNPRCRKSREALEILVSNGISEENGNLEIVLYLTNPLTKKEILDIASMLNMRPIEFTRTKESTFKDLKIDKKTVTDDKMIAHMVKTPILIERPIVIKDGVRAAIGRPPENIKSLLLD